MSVTAVPLRPIQPGSVFRFSLAMVLVAVSAVGLAWAGQGQFGRTPSGIVYQVLTPGKGEHPTREDFGRIGYKGTLPDGTVFDENPDAAIEIATTVPGFAEAITLTRKGSRLRAWLPAALAYGATPPQGSVIPPNSPLAFEINLLDFKTRAEIMEMQRQQQMQQMLQQQMPGGGAPGGPGGPGGPPPQ